MKKFIISIILLVMLSMPTASFAAWLNLSSIKIYEITVETCKTSYTWTGYNVTRSITDGHTYVRFIDVSTGKQIEITGTTVIIKDLGWQ